MPSLRTSAALTLSLAASALGAAAPAQAAPAPAVPGELIVRFQPGVDAGERVSARSEADVEFERSLPLSRVQLVSTEPGQSVAGARTELEGSPDVVYAEPNFVRRLEAVPNDPYFSLMYGLHNTGQSGGTPDADIDAPEAWEQTTGSPQVVAAVVDTGIDVSHPDLSSSIWANPGESGGGRETNGIDDDANGLVDDWRGWDWVADDNLPADENDHGTHVSGTIAGSGNNGVGVTGVSWSSKVMPLRVLDADGSGSVADLVAAYRYAGAMGARVLNASLGGSGFSNSELAAINAAPETLFVVAAGNGGEDGVGDNVDSTPEYPCAYPAPNIVCVAAGDRNDALAGFSNFSSTAVDLAAPGVSTLSTIPGGGYAYFSGTSMATPHVAGVAALIFSLAPETTVAGAKAALLDGADPKPAFASKTVTGGRLNAEGSLLEVGDGSPAPAPPPPAPVPAATPAPAPAAPDPEPEDPEPTAPGFVDRSAPALSLAVASPRRLRLALSRGLALRVRCSERCGVTLRMIVDGRTARRSRLSSHRRAAVVGRARVVAHRGTSRVVLKFGRRARALLRRLGSVRLTIASTARDRSGNVQRSRLRVRLRR